MGQKQLCFCFPHDPVQKAKRSKNWYRKQVIDEKQVSCVPNKYYYSRVCSVHFNTQIIGLKSDAFKSSWRANEVSYPSAYLRIHENLPTYLTASPKPSWPTSAFSKSRIANENNEIQGRIWNILAPDRIQICTFCLSSQACNRCTTWACYPILTNWALNTLVTTPLRDEAPHPVPKNSHTHTRTHKWCHCLPPPASPCWPLPATLPATLLASQSTGLSSGLATSLHTGPPQAALTHLSSNSTQRPRKLVMNRPPLTRLKPAPSVLQIRQNIPDRTVYKSDEDTDYSPNPEAAPSVISETGDADVRPRSICSWRNCSRRRNSRCNYQRTDAIHVNKEIKSRWNVFNTKNSCVKTFVPND